MNEIESAVRRAARALESLADGVKDVEVSTPRKKVVAACARGYFRPVEDDALFDWFARHLTLRDALWEVVDDVSTPVGGRLDRLETEAHWRLFMAGYSAACLLVRLDRLLVEDLATHSVVQRKMNEGSAERRIPRKQFTAVYESLSRPSTALLMAEAMHTARRQRQRLEAMRDDPELGFLAQTLDWLEEPLDPSKSRYVRLLLGWSEHALRRWAASTSQQTSFAVLESSGRLVAELRDQWRQKRVDDPVRREIQALLEPGDVFATRHEWAMTNLFLPGFWPHAALYVGTEAERERLGVASPRSSPSPGLEKLCVLEALKDGVHLRPLEETLGVDAVAVIRPCLDEGLLASAIERSLEHEGKLYNFDFDFFRSDRLVCTEVIYRAYDGLGPMHIALTSRAGRPTLSAEDLLDLAFDSDLFEVVLIYGAPGCEDRLLTGGEATTALARSYRRSDSKPS